MEKIHKYFPNLTHKQIIQFSKLEELYHYWNARINVISRKDINQLYINHILHSLAISKIIKFKTGSKILDIGTGGGFPGIPLAILFPKSHFFLVDSIQKKIKVTTEISTSINLSNVTSIHERAENIKDTFDFIISRGVTNIKTLAKWVEGKLKSEHNNLLTNGMIFLKGGDLSEELKGIEHTEYKIADFFTEDFFTTKKIIYIEGEVNSVIFSQKNK